MQIVNNKQLSEILGISEASVRKYISNGKINNKLLKCGYKLIKRFKKGRKFLCEIDEISENKNTLNGIGKGIFNTNKLNELCDYIMYRDENEDLPISKQYLSEKCNVSRATVSKWDKIMIENGFMSDDGYFYVVKCLNSDKSLKGYSLTNEEEYKSYISSTYKIRMAKNKLKKKLTENKIDSEEFDMFNDALTESLYIANDNKIVYKINKYNIERNNKLYSEIVNLIEETLNSKVKSDYRQYWLENSINTNWRLKEYEMKKEANNIINEKLLELGITVK